MKGDNYVFGIIGLGTMGRSLLLNMADHEFKVAGLDKDKVKADLLIKETSRTNVRGFTDVKEFLG